jgi:hypothetical protein
MARIPGSQLADDNQGQLFGRALVIAPNIADIKGWSTVPWSWHSTNAKHCCSMSLTSSCLILLERSEDTSTIGDSSPDIKPRRVRLWNYEHLLGSGSSTQLQPNFCLASTRIALQWEPIIRSCRVADRRKCNFVRLYDDR